MVISSVPSKRIAYLVIPVLLIFLAYTSFPKALAGAQQKPDVMVKEGLELYNNGQYEDAIPILKEATGLTKDKRLLSDAFFCLSLCYFQLGSMEETKQFIRKTIEVDPTKKIDENRYAPEYYALFLDLSKPKPKPVTGNIQVNSNPAGAQIFLDSADTGNKTNSTLNDISVGDHTIAVVKEGYKEYEQKVSVKQGKTQALNIQLKAAETGTQIATTQGRQPKPGGGVKWGRIALIGAVVIVAAAAAYFLLRPNTGSIQVNSTPSGAQILLDGTATGKTSNATLEDISLGEHTIRLTKEGFAAYEQKVTVSRGKTEVINATLVSDTIKVTAPEAGSTWAKGRAAEITWTTAPGAGQKSLQGAGRFTNMTNASSYFRRLSIFQARARFGRESGRRGSEAESPRSRSLVASGQRTTGLRQESGNPSPSLEGNGWSGPKASLGLQGIRAQGLYLNPQTSQAPPSDKQNPPFARPAMKGHGLDIAQVKIDLYKGGAIKETIVSATENDRSYSWPVPTTLEDGTDYKIRVSCSSDATVFGESGLFSIKEASLEITLPALNTVWGKGTTEKIKWTSTFSKSEKVAIYLLKGTEVEKQIEQSIPNSESYSWKIPPDVDFEEFWDYHIRISLVLDESVKGESPSFIITKLKYDLEKTTLLNSQPHGITIVPSGSVWITETNAHMIRNLGANIVFPGIQFGAFGSGWDQLNQPKGIAADLQNDYIYVVDSQNNRIKKYLNGYTQQLIGSLGAGDNQFDSPYGIAVDSVGNVYVTDQNNKRVQKFQTNPNFAFIKNWLIGGAPRGIACDPDINRDSVYVVDSDNREVRPYSLDGGPKTPWSIAGNPFGIAVDKWGFVYVIDAQGDRFLKFTPTGTLCYEKGGLFNNPIDICVDGYGYVLITNVGNSQIIRLK